MKSITIGAVLSVCAIANAATSETIRYDLYVDGLKFEKLGTFHNGESGVVDVTWKVFSIEISRDYLSWEDLNGITIDVRNLWIYRLSPFEYDEDALKASIRNTLGAEEDISLGSAFEFEISSALYELNGLSIFPLLDTSVGAFSDDASNFEITFGEMGAIEEFSFARYANDGPDGFIENISLETYKLYNFDDEYFYDTDTGEFLTESTTTESLDTPYWIYEGDLPTPNLGSSGDPGFNTVPLPASAPMLFFAAAALACARFPQRRS